MPDSALGSAFRSTCRICPPRRAPGCTAARHRSNSRCSTGSQCRCRRCDARSQWGHLWSRHRPGNPSCRWVQGSGCSPSRDSGGECLDKCRLRFRPHAAREYPRDFHFVRCRPPRSTCTRCTWSCQSGIDTARRARADAVARCWSRSRTAKPPPRRPDSPRWSGGRRRRLPELVRVGAVPCTAPLIRVGAHSVKRSSGAGTHIRLATKQMSAGTRTRIDL